MKKLLLLVLSVMSSNMLWAQIETDRPDYTESPNVVPVKALQIETGIVVFAHALEQTTCTDIKTRNITLNTTLIRLGIGAKTELRLNWSVNQIQRHAVNGGTGDLCPQILIDSKSSRTGLLPVFVGVKHNLHKGEQVSIGFLGHVYVPFLSTSDFKTAHFAPEFLLPVGISVTDRFSVSVQLGMSWDGEHKEPIGMYTLALGYGLTDRWGLFLEPFGYMDKNANSSSIVDRRINGGATFKLNDSFQLDASAGIHKGNSDGFTDYFISCGFSYLYKK